ncbi:MAG: DUF2948 family protein [Silicimonas sp.]|nr:DUF2948 family protein [Silicimonas sp.]
MSEDARFEDAAERPLRLRAEDADDLGVLAALVQDAVLPGAEVAWSPAKRRFACLLNRFRWEDKAANVSGHAPERVQAVLVFEDVLAVQSQGLTPAEMKEAVLSLLTLTFEPGEDGAGRILLTLAGDGAVALKVETINVTLQDVTRPYRAPSGQRPSHPE